MVKLEDHMEKINPTKQFWLNLRSVFSLAWRTNRLYFSLEIFFTILTAIFPVALSYTFKLVIDAVVKTQSTTGIVGVALLSVFALRYLIDLIADLSNTFSGWYLQAALQQQLTDKLTLEFTKKISELDIPHLENSETQNLIQKARQAYPWRITNFYNFMMDGFGSMVTFMSAIVVLLPFGVWIPVVMVLGTIPRFYYRNKYIKANWARFNETIGDSKDLRYVTGLLDDPSGVKEIRVSQAGPYLLKRVKNLQDHLFEMIRKPLKKYLPGFMGSVIVEAIVLFALVYLKLPVVVASGITIGTFTFYVQNLDRISNSSSGLVSSITRVFEQNLYVGYFFDVLALPKIIKEKTPGFEFDEIAPPKIEFRHVSFSYGDGPEVLKNVSFIVEPGQHFAIVGPNGAGKTTIVRLLLRFYDPNKGQILINDVDLREMRLRNWYKFVSILFQDFVKFHLTIKDNILLGDSSAIDEVRMKVAARKAGALEFIENLPKGYDTRLGKRFDDSSELSQGQWQKLALARMFYESAPVLILDEPTSAIDAEAEAEIFDNIDKVYENKNLILISHRFSTVRNADKIIVLEKGKAVEEGSHDLLMKQGGDYARMFRIQAKGYIE